MSETRARRYRGIETKKAFLVEQLKNIIYLQPQTPQETLLKCIFVTDLLPTIIARRGFVLIINNLNLISWI